MASRIFLVTKPEDCENINKLCEKLHNKGTKYEIDYDFSDTVKRGYVIKQSIKAGSMVSVDGTNELQKTLVITISKGPKIEVPDLMKMSLEDITNWVIKNKLKIINSSMVH